MVWDIHARRADRHDDHVTRVKARWTGLGSIDDVSLDCGLGVHAVSVVPSIRREMNAFSKPIDGVFRWDTETQAPEVVLTWTDSGEPCQESILLADLVHHGLSRGLRNVLHGRPHEDAQPKTGSG
jgi:hypothetical protein